MSPNSSVVKTRSVLHSKLPPSPVLGPNRSTPQRGARVAGILYFAIIALGLFGELDVRGSLVVPGDAAATLDNISNSTLLWRAGMVGDLRMHVLDLPVMWML